MLSVEAADGHDHSHTRDLRSLKHQDQKSGQSSSVGVHQKRERVQLVHQHCNWRLLGKTFQNVHNGLWYTQPRVQITNRGNVCWNKIRFDCQERPAGISQGAAQPRQERRFPGPGLAEHCNNMYFGIDCTFRDQRELWPFQPAAIGILRPTRTERWRRIQMLEICARELTRRLGAIHVKRAPPLGNPDGLLARQLDPPG